MELRFSMILEFSVENHRSFRGETTLSFVSTSRKDEPLYRFKTPHSTHGVLPVVGVWGANASGKSNILDVLVTLRDLVRDSHRKFGPNDPIPFHPWGLNYTGEPTNIEIEFIDENNQRTLFGFSFNALEFLEEYLYIWKTSRRSKIYERKNGKWSFGNLLTGQKNLISESTRKNSLFLSASAQYNHSQLLSIYNYISNSIICQNKEENGLEMIENMPIYSQDHPFISPKTKPFLSQLLLKSDIGITQVKFEEIDIELPTEIQSMLNQPFFNELPKKIKDLIPQFNSSNQKSIGITFIHNNSFELPPQNESLGTHVLLHKLSQILPVLKNGSIIVLDEIDKSLHPDLCTILIGLFTNEQTNPNKAQLLFTTHNRDIFNSLRSDEILLIDKNRSGESSLKYSSDFRDVRSRDNLHKVHSQGRIGAVPNIEEDDIHEIVQDFVSNKNEQV